MRSLQRPPSLFRMARVLVVATMIAGMITVSSWPGNTAMGLDLAELEITLPFDWWWFFRNQNEEAVDPCYVRKIEPGPGAGLVGFQHMAEEHLLGDCKHALTYETRVKPNLGPLGAQQAKLILQARITYDERILTREEGDVNRPTCIAEMAGSSSEDPSNNFLYPTYDSGASRQGPNAWDITGVFRSWFTGSADNHGVVLKGFDEGFPFNNGACVSEVNNFQIVVKFMGEVTSAPVSAPSIAGERRPGIDSLSVEGLPTGSGNSSSSIAGERRPGIDSINVEGHPTTTPEPVDPDNADNASNTGPTPTPIGLPAGAASSTGPTPTPIELPAGARSISAPRILGDGLINVESKPTVDVKVSTIEVRGKGVRRGNDCDPGANSVRVTIKNEGDTDATGLSVRLAVDGANVGEESVASLGDGKDTVVTFDDVDLKKGERRLQALVNTSGTFNASDESALERKVQCSDD
jgi:hypothetical protein